MKKFKENIPKNYQTVAIVSSCKVSYIWDLSLAIALVQLLEHIKNLENILELRTLAYVNKLRKETNLPDS